MAKTPKLKGKTNANPRTRASRHALPASETISVSKTADDITLTQPDKKSKALRPVVNGGVTKKKATTGKPKTRNQKLRQAKTLQRAEAVVDQRVKKVSGAGEREKRRRERRKVWDEVNGEVERGRMGKVRAGAKGEGNLQEGGDDDEEADRDGDVDMLPSKHAPKKRQKKTRMVRKPGKQQEDLVGVELAPELIDGEPVWALTEEEYSSEEEEEDKAYAFKRMSGFGDAVPAPTEIFHGIEVPVAVAGDEHKVVVPPENGDGIDEIT